MERPAFKPELNSGWFSPASKIICVINGESSARLKLYRQAWIVWTCDIK